MAYLVSGFFLLKRTEERLMNTGVDSHWYIASMKHLVEVVQELSQARDLDSVTRIVREAARNLTGADGATFVLRDGDQCYYAEENAISPLWKGKCFPMSNCVSGWVMLNSKPAVIEDIYSDPRVPADAYRPTFVKSMAMVPIRMSNPIGAIGNYWAKQRMPTDEEVQILQALANTTSVAMENAQLYENLQEKINELQASEKRIKGQHEILSVFTKALAHDLKEPMRTIHSFTDLIFETEKLSEEGKKLFQFVKNSSSRMLMLIDKVMAYTNTDNRTNVAKEQCDVMDIVDAVQENLAQLIKERNATVICNPLPKISGDRTHLTQVFQNLISNAIHYNNNAPVINISVNKRGEQWVFSVKDNGVGINEKNLKRIFEPLKRAHGNMAEGAGLGLAICQKIVESYGGEIWCESKEFAGSTFHFSMPTSVPQNSAVNDPVVVSKKRAKNKNNKKESLANILLVDDRVADLELAKITLTKRLNIKCNIQTTQTGKEALDILIRRAKEDAPINLVLLDINMPGMDGFELLEQLRAHNVLKDVTVMMCTCSIHEKDIAKAKSMGVGYLTKPINLNTLRNEVAKTKILSLNQEGSGYSLIAAA